MTCHTEALDDYARIMPPFELRKILVGGDSEEQTG
jgi:hypothetical protein